MIKQIRIITIILILVGLLFNINLINAIIISHGSNNITLTSPINNEVYYKMKVNFNLSSSSLLNEVAYANLMDTGARCAESEMFENTCWKILCSECNGYGNKKEKKLTMNEGMNKLVIRVTDKNGSLIYYNLTIIVESIKPKIISTFPRSNEIVNGSIFYIIYDEYNLKNIILVYGNDNNYRNMTKNCTSGKNQVCSFPLNLTDYESESLYYYFILNNLIYNLHSQTRRFSVDTISPKLAINSPKENMHYFKKTNFNFTATEKSKVEYMDKNDNIPVWKTICNNCDDFGSKNEITKSMLKGNHDLLIRATDKAGNSNVKEINFEID